jgi:hypothetical protein
MPRSGLRRYFRHGTFPQMVVFEAVARLGSVTRAAEELHLAQPTISTQIKKLAQSLDVALFEQQGRGLLTPAGRELQQVCGELPDCSSAPRPGWPHCAPLDRRCAHGGARRAAVGAAGGGILLALPQGGSPACRARRN